MGVGSLKKGASAGAEKAATSSQADDFINGARVDGKAKPPAPRKKKWKQITFSLSDEIDQEVDRLSLLPSGVRVTRSDVVREALRLLAAQGDSKAAELLKEAKEREAD